MILDFRTFANPLTFLQSLLVFPPAEEKIYIGLHNIETVAILPEHGYEFFVDLREDTLDDVFGGFNLSFEEDNIPLAVRILQFTLKNEYIQILDEEESETGWQIVHDKIRKQNASYGNMFPTVHNKKTNCLICPDFGQHSFSSDLGLAINYNQNIVSGNKYALSLMDNFSEDGLFTKLNDDIYVDVIRQWEPKNLNEVFRVIEAPTLLPNIVDSTKALLQEKEYKKDLKLFLPKWGLDLATGGISSLVEMFIRVFRHNWRK